MEHNKNIKILILGPTPFGYILQLAKKWPSPKIWKLRKTPQIQEGCIHDETRLEQKLFLDMKAQYLYFTKPMWVPWVIALQNCNLRK